MRPFFRLLSCGLLVLWACELREEGDPPVQPPPMAFDAGSVSEPEPGFGTAGGTGSLGGLGTLGGTTLFPQGGTFAGTTGLIGGLIGPGAGSPRPVRLTELRTAAAPPPPISGGTLIVSSDGSQVVASDPDRDLVYVLNPKELKVQKVSLARGSEPGRVVLDGAGAAHVALRGTGKLARIDLARAALATETAVCTHLRGVAFDAKNGSVVAACMDGQLVSLDAATHRELARQTLPSDLRDVLVSPAGARWATRYRSAELLTLGADSVKNTTRPPLANGRRGADPTLAFDVFVPPEVSEKTLPIVLPPTAPGTFSPTLAWRAVSSARGGVWMLHQRSQEEEVVTTSGGYGSGCQTITSAAATEFAADGTPVRTMPINLQGLSVDAALSPDEKWLAVASPGGFVRGLGTLQLYNTNTALPPTTMSMCGGPVFAGSDENQVVSVGFDGAGALYALSREPAELQIYDLQLSTPSTNPLGSAPSPVLMRRVTLALDTRSVRDTGHDLFHADVGQGLACASCHGEVLDDGHVWNFQKIGPRRTQNVRGGLLATAPFHWDGDMMSMSHLVDEVMTRRMGGFPIDLAFATALAGWVEQQPALSLPAKDSAAVARGKELFNSAETACSTCHSGAKLTNNENRDVGTGGSFQVPGLLGLALRAPYMHNGCAKTLADRFVPACGGGDAHGKTSQLTEAQRTDLIAYLNSL